MMADEKQEMKGQRKERMFGVKHRFCSLIIDYVVISFCHELSNSVSHCRKLLNFCTSKSIVPLEIIVRRGVI